MTKNESDSSTNRDVQRWLITQLKRRLEYLIMISGRGYNVEAVEISKLEEEIKEAEDKLNASE